MVRKFIIRNIHYHESNSYDPGKNGLITRICIPLHGLWRFNHVTGGHADLFTGVQVIAMNIFASLRELNHRARPLAVSATRGLIEGATIIGSTASDTSGT